MAARCRQSGCPERARRGCDGNCARHHAERWSFDEARRGAERLSAIGVGPWMVVVLPDDCTTQKIARSVGLTAYGDYSTRYRREMADRVCEVYRDGVRIEQTELAP